MMADHCPICSTRLNAKPIASSRAVKFDCPRCGRYYLHSSLESAMKEGAIQLDSLLSSWLRQNAERGQESDLTVENVDRVLESLPRYSVPHKLDMVLRLLADRTTAPGESAKLHLEQDGSLVWMVNTDEFNFFLVALRDRGLIRYAGTPEDAAATITVAGWERLDELGRTDTRSGRAFVAMWFDEEMRATYDDAIAPAICEAGYEPYRVDDDHHGDRIDARIMNAIEESRFVVADVTGQRTSVYFEAGYALALRRPVIWSVREDELSKVAFDSRQFPHIAWSSANDLRRELVEQIKARIGQRVS